MFTVEFDRVCWYAQGYFLACETGDLHMIFVSYSHRDKEWLRRFKMILKPLSRYAEVNVWSDQQIQSGAAWRDEIGKAMTNAFAAVLLVSANFLDSDFIAKEELPFILDAAQRQKIRLFWIRLTPCYIQATPLKSLQAAAGMPKPLNQMAEFEWMEAFCNVCGDLDEIVKRFETPVINSGLNHSTLARVQKDLKVLAKPAYRETEVLIYSGDGWHTQSRVAKGSMTASCWIGDLKNTKPGDSFKIVAITRDEGRLSPGSRHASIPAHRTKSKANHCQAGAQHSLRFSRFLVLFEHIG